MGSQHITKGEIERFFRGNATAEEASLVLRHLAKGCSTCSQQARHEWPPTPLDLTSNGVLASEYERAFDRGSEQALASAEVAPSEKAAATQRVDSLLRLPREQWSETAVKQRHVQTALDCTLLLDKAKEQISSKPRAYLALAELALGIANELRPPHIRRALLNDLRGRAHSHVGNAWKILGDLVSSDSHLAQAGELLEKGTGDLFRQARLFHLTASLRMVQRRFREGLRLEARALRIYRRLGERYWIGRKLIDLGVYLHKADQLPRAIEHLKEGLAVIDPAEEWQSALIAHHNLVLCFIDTGELDQAARHLEIDRELQLRGAKPTHLISLRWVEGRLARAMGRNSEAETAFLEVRDHFLEEQIPHEVANVGLDLSLIYLSQHRWSELRSVTSMMVEVYESKGIHREALAALMLYERAVEAEVLTADFVSQLRAFLEKAVADSTSRFRPQL